MEFSQNKRHCTRVACIFISILTRDIILSSPRILESARIDSEIQTLNGSPSFHFCISAKRGKPAPSPPLQGVCTNCLHLFSYMPMDMSVAYKTPDKGGFEPGRLVFEQSVRSVRCAARTL